MGIEDYTNYIINKEYEYSRYLNNYIYDMKESLYRTTMDSYYYDYYSTENNNFNRNINLLTNFKLHLKYNISKIKFLNSDNPIIENYRDIYNRFRTLFSYNLNVYDTISEIDTILKEIYTYHNKKY